MSSAHRGCFSLSNIRPPRSRSGPQGTDRSPRPPDFSPVLRGQIFRKYARSLARGSRFRDPSHRSAETTRILSNTPRSSLPDPYISLRCPKDCKAPPASISRRKPPDDLPTDGLPTDVLPAGVLPADGLSSLHRLRSGSRAAVLSGVSARQRLTPSCGRPVFSDTT